jgi:hypothetical protein
MDVDERFDYDDEDNFTGECNDFENLCGEDGWIRLNCTFDENRGVLYNDKVVLTPEEVLKYFRDLEVDADPTEIVDPFHRQFYMDNKRVGWYYFYCTPDKSKMTKDDILYISDEMDRVLEKKDGLLLYKDGKYNKVGYSGAHVHVLIAR